MIPANNWHFGRPELAKKYLGLFKLGLTSARGLFARRRMGKTEFLKNDLIPLAQLEGYTTVYANLWDLESDPAVIIVSELYQAIKSTGFQETWSKLKKTVKKISATASIGIAKGSIEAQLAENQQVVGTMLMDVMKAFDKTTMHMIVVIDEAQVLAYESNTHFAHALRAALDIRKDRIKVIFAGSSETTLRRMFGVPAEPFYNWAPLEPFELLGKEFVEAMVKQVNKISKYPLSLQKALDAFEHLKRTPEFFRRYIEYYVTNPLAGAEHALEVTQSKVFNDKGFKQQWDNLLPIDRIILFVIAKGKSDLYGKETMGFIGNSLGIEQGIDKTSIQNAQRRLTSANIITKMQYGLYQFEDEAFADWVKHND